MIVLKYAKLNALNLFTIWQKLNTILIESIYSKYLSNKVYIVSMYLSNLVNWTAVSLSIKSKMKNNVMTWPVDDPLLLSSIEARMLHRMLMAQT